MQNRPDDGAPETGLRRRIAGFFMFPVALFPLLALVSYDWRSIPDLCVPPAPTSNLIGVAGDRFAYWGYQFAGLGVLRTGGVPFWTFLSASWVHWLWWSRGECLVATARFFLFGMFCRRRGLSF